MKSIRAIITDRRLELQAPPDWPDGTEVRIEPTSFQTRAIGLDESEWRDGPEVLAEWDAWIKTIEPLEYTPEEAATMAEFAGRMKRYNVEAVGRQLSEGPRE